MEKRMQRQKAKNSKEVEKEADRIRQRQIEEEGGESIYNPEYSEYYWLGEGEPVHDDPECIQQSETQLTNLQCQEDERLAAMIEEKKTCQEKREDRKKRTESSHEQSNQSSSCARE